MSHILELPDKTLVTIDWEGLHPEGAWISITVEDISTGDAQLILLDEPALVDRFIDLLNQYKEEAWPQT